MPPSDLDFEGYAARVRAEPRRWKEAFHEFAAAYAASVAAPAWRPAPLPLSFYALPVGLAPLTACDVARLAKGVAAAAARGVLERAAADPALADAVNDLRDAVGQLQIDVDALRKAAGDAR